MSPTSSSSDELMVVGTLNREESCGGHFREEHQTEEGEARRDDENWQHVSAWSSPVSVKSLSNKKSS